MPIKDPEERREYQRNLMRLRRAKAANSAIIKACPQKGKRKPPAPPTNCSLSQALTEELEAAEPQLALNPFNWEQDKSQLGSRLVTKGKALLEIDPELALKLIKQGAEMIESCLPVLRAENDDDSQGMDWASVLSPQQTQVLTEMLVDHAQPQGARTPP